MAVGGYALLWGRIAVTLPNLDEDYVGQVGLEALMAGWQRLGLILPALGRQVIDWPSWNATWPALALLLALGWRSLGRPAMRLLVVVLLIQLASYVYAYMITAWSSPSAEAIIEYEGESDPLFFLLTLTLGRLLMHIAPLAILLGLLVSPPRLRGAG